MQLPVSSRASQCIVQPFEGISKTSPGTSNSVDIISVFSESPVPFSVQQLLRKTVQTSELLTVDFKFR